MDGGGSGAASGSGGGAASSSASNAPLLISGTGEAGQHLVLSPEDAAQLLAQAGIQLGDNEQVIIGDVGQGQADQGGIVAVQGQGGDLGSAEQQQVIKHNTSITVAMCACFSR